MRSYPLAIELPSLQASRSPQAQIPYMVEVRNLVHLCVRRCAHRWTVTPTHLPRPGFLQHSPHTHIYLLHDLLRITLAGQDRRVWPGHDVLVEPVVSVGKLTSRALSTRYLNGLWPSLAGTGYYHGWPWQSLVGAGYPWLALAILNCFSEAAYYFRTKQSGCRPELLWLRLSSACGVRRAVRDRGPGHRSI